MPALPEEDKVPMFNFRHSSCPLLRNTFLLPLALLTLQACSPAADTMPPAEQAAASLPITPAPAAMPELAPISVSGSYWIELSPVITAATSFYHVQLPMGEGGITRITSGDADLATNAETQLLRETLVNPDLRIIATETESFYRLFGRRSAGIETLADIRGKRVMLPPNTSANYYLVAMLRTVGLTEDDVEILPLPPAEGDQTGMDRMSDALAAGETDVISIWEPEPDDAIRQLGDDAIVFQDRSVYREVFNLHARATDLANPEKRRSIVEFMRALIRATEALKTDPEPYWSRVTEVTGFTHEEIEGGWPEMAFPVDIIPDMLDVLETEDLWVAKERDRAPRSREELAQYIDRSVVEEARAGL
jgi:sulfonate transport system substrate-binding protein